MMVAYPSNLVHFSRRGPRVVRRVAVGCLAIAALWIVADRALAQQEAPGHHLNQASMPPGAIGQRQLLRGGPLPGYFQPVSIKAPAGALVALAIDGRFGTPELAPTKVGMLIGPVYRLRVTNIPLAVGVEVFPTIEIVDRLYPPAGQELRFPLEIELTPEDLALAAAGKFVTRVIYLEDPETALPARQVKGEQNWFDVAAGRDPLAAADALGRPVAILRLGGRLPENSESPDPAFLYHCPPLVRFVAPPAENTLPPAQPAATPTPATTWRPQPGPR